jgi:TPR repeat protein
MAREYLAGKGGHPDGAAAEKVLWKAVANQNGAALLLLSDLYSSGNGVPKNCDQARLLLDAAMRKGVPMANAKFRDLQKTCP